jgi:chemotaxis protein CheX
MTQSVTKIDSPASGCAIAREEVVEMTHELFGPMFGIEIETADNFDGNNVSSSAWQASVGIDGEWAAEVQTIIPEKLAQRVACTMFSMTSDELTDGDMQDAMGEVVNIIGGNIKGIVGVESNLSLPCVALFQDLLADADLKVGFKCEDEQLLVLVKQN